MSRKLEALCECIVGTTCDSYISPTTTIPTVKATGTVPTVPTSKPNCNIPILATQSYMYEITLQAVLIVY